MEIPIEEQKSLSELTGLLAFKRTWLCANLLNRKEKTICLFTGNQAGKTLSVACDYVHRIMGKHPVPEKNILPTTPIRIFRFASEMLPNDPEGGEVKNTQYPAFKKLLPPYLLKKDITIRKPVMTIFDPQGGPDIYVEFVSYNQSVQAMAGVQRASVWLDESAGKTFYEEQLPRLFASNGDLIYSLTPANYISWEFEELFERAKVYIRSPLVCKRMEDRFGKKVSTYEETDSRGDISVIMSASDDNPILDPKVIEEKYAMVSDEDVIDIRRYGIFAQVSGQIFKEYDNRIHLISAGKYFPDGIPDTWFHARGVDYHERSPWAVGWIALSPQNEAFIYNEYSPSPEKMINFEMARGIAVRSKDIKYSLNLIDPLAAKMQTNTGISTLDDMNRFFYEFKKERLCTGGYWQTWDTKSDRGRDILKERLQNSKRVGKPSNNRIVKNGREQQLPTLWILDNCKETEQGFKSWRWEEYKDRDQLVTKDEKNTPQQKWSHYPMVYEALFKNPSFSVGRYKSQLVRERESPHARYFTARG